MLNTSTQQQLLTTENPNQGLSGSSKLQGQAAPTQVSPTPPSPDYHNSTKFLDQNEPIVYQDDISEKVDDQAAECSSEEYSQLMEFLQEDKSDQIDTAENMDDIQLFQQQYDSYASSNKKYQGRNRRNSDSREKPMFLHYRCYRPREFWKSDKLLYQIYSMDNIEAILQLAKNNYTLKKHLTGQQIGGLCNRLIFLGDYDGDQQFQLQTQRMNSQLVRNSPFLQTLFGEIIKQMPQLDIMGFIDAIWLSRLHPNPVNFRNKLINYVAKSDQLLQAAMQPQFYAPFVYQLSVSFNSGEKLEYIPTNVQTKILQSTKIKVYKLNVNQIYAFWHFLKTIQPQKRIQIKYFPELITQTVNLVPQMDITFISWLGLCLSAANFPVPILAAFIAKIRADLTTSFQPGPIFRTLYFFAFSGYPMGANMVNHLTNVACHRQGAVADVDLDRVAKALLKYQYKNDSMSHWLTNEVVRPHRGNFIQLKYLADIYKYILFNGHKNIELFEIFRDRIDREIQTSDAGVLVDCFQVLNKYYELFGNYNQIQKDELIIKLAEVITNQFQDLPIQKCYIAMEAISALEQNQKFMDKIPRMVQKRSKNQQIDRLKPQEIGVTLRFFVRYEVVPEAAWLKSVEDKIMKNIQDYLYANILDLVSLWQRIGQHQWAANLMTRLLESSLPGSAQTLFYMYKQSVLLSSPKLAELLYERSVEWLKIAPDVTIFTFFNKLLSKNFASTRGFVKQWVQNFEKLDREKSIQLLRNYCNQGHARSRVLMEHVVYFLDPKILQKLSMDDSQWIVQQVIRNCRENKLKSGWAEGLRQGVKNNPQKWKTSTIIDILHFFTRIDENSNDARTELSDILLHDKLMDLSAAQLCTLHQMAKDQKDNTLIGNVERRFVQWIRSVSLEQYDYLNYHLVENRIDSIQIWETFAQKIMLTLDYMDHMQLSWLLWGMVKSGFAPSRDFMRKFNLVVINKINKLDFGSLATIMWCHGKILYKEPELCEAVGKRVLQMVEGPSQGQEQLSNQEPRKNQGQGQVLDLDNESNGVLVVEGESKQGQILSEVTDNSHNQHRIDHLQECGVNLKRISILTWGLAELEYEPDGYFEWAYNQIEYLIVQQPESASAVITFLWAAHTLQYEHQRPQLVANVVSIVQDNLQELYDDELANLAYLCVKWRIHLSDPENWHRNLIYEIQNRVENLEYTHLAQILWVFAESGRDIPRSLVRQLNDRAEINIFGAGDKNVINIIWSFLQLKCKPYNLISQWCKFVNENILNLEMETLAATIWIMGELETFMITPNQQQLIAHILQQINLRQYELTPQGVTRLLSGLIKLRIEEAGVIKFLLNELINFGIDVPLDDYVLIYKMLIENETDVGRASFVELINAVIWQPVSRIQQFLSTQGLADLVEIMASNYKHEYSNMMVAWEQDLCVRLQRGDFNNWENLSTIVLSYAKCRVDIPQFLEQIKQKISNEYQNTSANTTTSNTIKTPLPMSWRHVGNLFLGYGILARNPGALLDILYSSIQVHRYLDEYSPEHCIHVLYSATIAQEFEHPAVLHTAQFLCERLKHFDIEQNFDIQRKLSQILLLGGAENHADLMATLNPDIKIKSLQEWISFQEQLQERQDTTWLLKTSRALRNMSINHDRKRIIQNGGLFCNIYLAQGAQNLATVIEVYGSIEMMRNSKRLVGDAVIRQRLYQAWGYQIVTLTQEEVEKISVDDLEIILQAKLAPVGLQ